MLPLFGLTEISSHWAADRTFVHSVEEVHEVLADALVALAGLHATAALVPHWDPYASRALEWLQPSQSRASARFLHGSRVVLNAP